MMQGNTTFINMRSIMDSVCVGCFFTIFPSIKFTSCGNIASYLIVI